MPSTVRTGKVPARLLRKATGCDPMCEECCDCRDGLESWLAPRIKRAVLNAIWSEVEALDIERPKRTPYYVEMFVECLVPDAINTATDYIMELRDRELKARHLACAQANVIRKWK